MFLRSGIKRLCTVFFTVILFFSISKQAFASYCGPYERNCPNGNYSGTFDDITTLDYLHLTTEYSMKDEILWNNFGILNVNSPNANNNPFGATVDFSRGIITPDYLAFNEDPTTESWMYFGVEPDAVSYLHGAYFYFPMFDPEDLNRELFATLTIKGFMTGATDPVHTINLRLSNMDDPVYVDLSSFRANTVHFISASDNDVYDFAYITADYKPQPVPEPSSILLGIIGITGAMGLKRKRQCK